MLRRLAPLTPTTALAILPCLCLAQRPAPRIRGPIEAQPSVALAGSLNPHIRTAQDLGPLAPDTPIAGVTLVFNRSAAQQADLDQLLTAQTNPASPLFHRWLTPDKFAARFGIPASDIDAAQTWLQSQGFTIDAVSRDRITFSGSAAQIQQAFGAELHRFRVPAANSNQPELHFAPASELLLPPALAPVTAAILHLSDFRPKPSVRTIHPDYTTLSTQEHFLAPKDLSSMYDLSNFLSQNRGVSGQALAIVGQSFVNTAAGSAIENFHTGIGMGNPGIAPVIVPGSGNEAIFPGDVGESEIDLEYSSSVTPDANIFFVYTGSSGNYDVFDALAFAITNDVAPVISISYGVCEPLLSASVLQQYNAILQQASAQGQTIVASSGDWGATACAPYGSSSGLSTTQQQGLAVSFPASSPYVTAVGGTQMASGTFAAGASNYWAAASVIDNAQSLLSYVPEVAWNESSSSYGIMASGGGPSSAFLRPSWQAGVPGIPAGNYRLVPDIALEASVFSPGYVICSDDPSLVGSATDCSSGSLKANNGNYILTGGTSFAAPVFGALLSALNRYEFSTGLGNINPVLYSLAAQPPVYASAFHDVTSGTTACAIGQGNCAIPGTSGYAATPGYDMATGLGSLDFTNLANAWPTEPTNGAVATWLQVSGIPQTANAGASSAVTVQVDIPCLSGYCYTPPPSGSVLISVDGQSPVPATLTPPPYPQPLYASATWNFIAPSSTGSHVVVVRYPGDAYHLASASTFSVLVGNVVPSGSFTLSAQNATVLNNSTGSTHIAITPAGGYNGALTWSLTYSGGNGAANFCYLVEPVPVNGPTTATMEIGAGSACNSPSGSVVHSSGPQSSLHPPALPSRKAPAAATFLTLLLFGLFPARRTRKLLPILSTILASIALTLSGCGGGSGSAGGGGGGGNPTAQVYTITMTAKDSVNSSITASTNFTLTVN